MSDRFLDKELTEDFIKENFNSKKDFVNAWGVSYSHFIKMINGKGKCGPRSIRKLDDLLKMYNSEAEDILEPVPMLIGDMSVLEIIIKDLEDNLIVYINSSKEIVDKNYKVEYILK